MKLKKIGFFIALYNLIATIVFAKDITDASYSLTNSTDGPTESSKIPYVKYKNDSVFGVSIKNGSIVGVGSLVNRQSDNISKVNGLLELEEDLEIIDISASKFTNNSITAQIGAGAFGGVIYVDKYLGKDVNISNSVFENNSANAEEAFSTIGGAIASLLDDKTLTISNSSFYDNSVTNNKGNGNVIESPLGNTGYVVGGGAIFTTGKTNVSNSDFSGNSASSDALSTRGGAIANYGGNLTVKDSSFTNNKVIGNNGREALGGAISNTQKDDAGEGGELTIVSQNKDVIFSGNTISGSNTSGKEMSNDIYNKGGSIANLNTNSSKRIVFNGGIDGNGDTNIININHSAANSEVDNNGTIVFNNTVSNNTINAYSGTIQLGLNGTDYNNFNVVGKYFDNTKLNIMGNVHISSLNGAIEQIDLGDIKMEDSGHLSLSIDVDALDGKTDVFNGNWLITTRASQVIDIKGIGVINDSPTASNLNIDISNITNLGTIGSVPDFAYGSIFKYQLNLNADGTLNFASLASSPVDFNPYLYEQSITLRQISSMQNYISESILSKALASMETRTHGDKNFGIWMDVVALRDTSKFDNFFSTVKGNYYSVLLGLDSGVKEFNNGANLFGNLYLGYLYGDYKYTENKLESNGFYFGGSLMSELNNFIAGVTANIGFLGTDAKNDFGKDKYDNTWFNIGTKFGYEFKLLHGFSIEPAVYLSYMFISSDDYYSNSGMRITGEDLNSFQIAPSVKFSKSFENQLSMFAKVKYIAEMVNDLDAKADSILLPDLDNDDYVEYGIGLDKKIEDVFSFGIDINRRDGGKRGWLGGINAKFFF